ncbi:EF-hand calcium-binding domain-containing protein [Dirofilaria immitis]
MIGSNLTRSNAKRQFVNAYLNEVGDMRNMVNRLQLYKILIAAGKDLLISDLETADCYQFNKAYGIFEQLPVIDFSEIMEQYHNCMDKTNQNDHFIALKELAESLKKDEEVNANEIKAIVDFLESFTTSGRIDCRKLFDEFEKSRNKLLDIVAQEFISKQTTIQKKPTGSENAQLKLLERKKLQYLNETTTTFTSQISRRAFRIMNNDDRVLNYHFILNQSQIVCVMCELYTSNQQSKSNDDQPIDRNYKNDIYIVLYDVIEEQVVTVTMKILKDKYVSEECLLKAGEYIISIQTPNCLEYNNMTSTSDQMKLVDSNGKLTKHFKMALMNMFDLFDFDENGKLSREEFDIYNKLASDEHVLDQEWEILCRNFGAKDGELLLNSFVALHQIEIDNNPTLEETWVTLLCVGYNEQLDLINNLQNCPCSFTIFSESVIYMGKIDLREPTLNETEALADYFWKNGHEIGIDVDVRIWKCDYFAVCVAGPMKLPYAMNLHYGNSKNILVKELTEVQRIPLKFIKPKILLQAIATGSDWSLILTVETII